MLKSKTKPHQGGKKRKQVELLVTLQDYQAQKAQAEYGAPGFKTVAQKLAQAQAKKVEQKKGGEMND